MTPPSPTIWYSEKTFIKGFFPKDAGLVLNSIQESSPTLSSTENRSFLSYPEVTRHPPLTAEHPQHLFCICVRFKKQYGSLLIDRFFPKMPPSAVKNCYISGMTGTEIQCDNGPVLTCFFLLRPSGCFMKKICTTWQLMSLHLRGHISHHNSFAFKRDSGFVCFFIAHEQTTGEIAGQSLIFPCHMGLGASLILVVSFQVG